MKIAIDTECTGGRFHLPPPGCDYPYYISTCDEDGNMKSWGYPALRIDPLTRVLEVSLDTLEAIRTYLSGYTEFVFHNAKFDLAALGTLGIYPREFGTINDTIFRYHLLDNTQSLKLKDLSLLHLDIPDDDESELLDILRQARRIAKNLGWAIVNADKEETGKGHWMKMDGWIPVQIAYEHPKLRPPAPLDAPHPWAHCLSRYGNRDAERTMALEILGERVMGESIPPTSQFLPSTKTLEARYQAQLEVINPIQTMEKYGVSINLDRLHSSLEYFQEKVECHRSLMQAILQVPDFNPASSKQLQAALFEEYRLPILKLTKGGGPSTDEETLLALNKCDKVVLNPDSDQAAFLDELLSFKSANSSFTHLKTYEEARVGNRLHSSFNPTGTNTTRFSSSGPNLQNIEKEEESEIDATTSAFFIRRVFGPESGRVWLDFDYDQLQLRIFAHVSRDKRMLAAFEAGWDAHNFMACQVFKTDSPTKLQRRVAKCFHPDTEVLTPQGWKRIVDTTIHDLVAQAEPECDGEVALQWVHPLEVFTKPNDFDHLVHLKNEGIDIRVTPDHRMLVWGQHKPRKVPKVVTPSEMPKQHLWANAGVLVTKDRNFEVDDLRRAVAIQADGSYQGQSVRFGFSKQRKIDRFEQLFRGLWHNRRYYSGNRSYNYSIKNDKLRGSLIWLDGKVLSWRLLNLPLRLRMEVVKELAKWDGTERDNWLAFRFSSTIEKNVDVAQALAASTGLKTRKTHNGYLWNLTIRDRATTKGGNCSCEEIPYSGEIACLSVPSSFVLVRDGGIPLVCGQSINFAFIFGAGPDKIEGVSGDPTIWPTVQKLFPGAVSFITNTIEAVRKSGQGTVNAHGYPLRVPQDQRGKPKAYAGVVYKIQGLEGLIVKRAMVGWDRYLKLVSEKNSPNNGGESTELRTFLPFAFLSLQVHDQLIADFKSIPEKFLKFHAKSLRNIMQEAGEYHGVTTPASCSIVRDSWDQPEEWEL